MLHPLTTRPLFPAPPDRAVVEAFLDHVRKTGSPETFPGISTTVPPLEGDLQMLAEKISVNTALRLGGDMAPCPMCSHGKPKWKHDGSLIWCEASKAIYCIGPRCSGVTWEQRLNVARNILRQTEKARADAAALVAAAGRAASVLVWIDRHADLARTVTHRHSALAKAAPKWRRSLHQALKATGYAIAQGTRDEQVIGRVFGVPFLAGGWNLSRDIEASAAVVRQLQADAGDDAAAWADGLTPSVRSERLAAVKASIRSLEKVRDRLDAAADFLAADTFRILAKWSANGPPTDFKVSLTATSADVRHREEMWKATLGSRRPEPVPA